MITPSFMKELNLVRTIVRDSNINRCIQNHSNDSRVSKTDVKSLVANIYWMVAFKIHVSHASLFEETPNRHCVKSIQMRRNF